VNVLFLRELSQLYYFLRPRINPSLVLAGIKRMCVPAASAARLLLVGGYI